MLLSLDLDLDLLELGERLRFLISAGEPDPTASEEGERLRRRTGLAEREVLHLARRWWRRRGGERERERDLDGLGAGELGFLWGDADRDGCLGSLLLSVLGENDRSRPASLRLRCGDGERRDGRGRGRDRDRDRERSLEGERLRRRGGVRERSDEGERRLRRGGGDGERLSSGERRRAGAGELPRRSRPRPLPPLRPLLGT